MSREVFGVPAPRGAQHWTAHDKARCDSFLSGLPGYGVPREWGDPSRCVVWRDRFGRARLIVAHYRNGRSAEVRIDANGNRKSAFGQWSNPAKPAGAQHESRQSREVREDG